MIATLPVILPVILALVLVVTCAWRLTTPPTRTILPAVASSGAAASAPTSGKRARSAERSIGQDSPAECTSMKASRCRQSSRPRSSL